ncbi:MAG: polysaccharide biosynthesis tyrosine autokinase [Bacteroidales bacterium]|nr:polysaccharide biosynthesis tyrosine autokinase [Bacteroidales bacterium]
MVNNSQFQNFEEESIDLKAYIYRLLRFWYVFPISLVLGLLVSFFVIKTTSPVYRVESSLLIKDEQSLMDPDAIIQNAVSPFSSMSEYKLRNEIEILNSYHLTERTMKELDFSVSYFEKEKYRINEIYNETPFIIEYDSSHVQLVEIDIYLQKLKNGHFHVWSSAINGLVYSYSEERIVKELFDVEIDDTIYKDVYFTNDYFKFKIKELAKIENEKIYLFKFRTLESLTNEFQKIQIEDIKYSSVIKIFYDGTNVSKSIDFLNRLLDVYLNRGVEKKNKIAINTIEFINSQINSIADSLKSAEKRLGAYRSSQKVMNIDFQSQQAYQNLESLQNQKAELILKQKYYTYLQEYLSDSKDLQDVIAPSSMGIDDQLLNNLIIELTRLYSEKVDIMVNSKKDNPYLESVKMKIDNQKNTLLENILNSIDRAKISLNDINERIDKLTIEVQSLPETQRMLFTYEREFQLQDALYTFLLRKKSELQIAKASTFPENEIIDYPKLIKPDPVSPNKKVILLLGIIMGLGLPVCCILLYDYFNDKIVDISDVEKIIDKPILGNIIHNKEKNPLVVHNSPNSIIAESFRSLRTNFQYVLGEIKTPVIMITSTMMEEGKSFISINLATSFALYQKKVVLLSFDLRRPSVSKLMDLHNEMGLSTFLSGNCNMEDIIFETEIPNLRVIPTGPIPPNPSELIASEKTKALFEELRKKFDYIILDTPPTGIVSDALLLEKFADTSVFIVRHNYSRKKMLSHLFYSLEKKNIKNTNLIINDINIKNKGYNYNYGYGYGYNYDYR